MCGKISGTLLAIILTTLIAPRIFADDKDVLLQDNFATLDPGWSNNSNVLHVDKNQLIMQLPNKQDTFDSLYKANVFGDADISVDVQMMNGGDGTEYAGPIFWATDIDNEYVVRIEEDGQFSVGRYSNGKLLFPVTWRANDSISKGLTKPTTIRVVTKGTSATVYVNGKEAITFKRQPPDGGGFIGVEGSASGKSAYAWEFSNLVVKKPAP
ncbi:MAG TPA: family 16 glycoside hydrolase [Pirellulales bacterium]|nr:family 16 glycoside hydrolase [Pirellulales bacterium]